MIAFGSKPVRPAAPSATMTIGAKARIGTVWDATIQGMRLASTLRTCTIAIANAMPSAAPIAKPTNVAESVTTAWYTRLRFDVTGHPNTLRASSATIWCGAGTIGLFWVMVASAIAVASGRPPARTMASAVMRQFAASAATYQRNCDRQDDARDWQRVATGAHRAPGPADRTGRRGLKHHRHVLPAGPRARDARARGSPAIRGSPGGALVQAARNRRCR